MNLPMNLCRFGAVNRLRHLLFAEFMKLHTDKDNNNVDFWTTAVPFRTAKRLFFFHKNIRILFVFFFFFRFIFINSSNFISLQNVVWHFVNWIHFVQLEFHFFFRSYFVHWCFWKFHEIYRHPIDCVEKYVAKPHLINS